MFEINCQYISYEEKQEFVGLALRQANHIRHNHFVPITAVNHQFMILRAVQGGEHSVGGS